MRHHQGPNSAAATCSVCGRRHNRDLGCRACQTKNQIWRKTQDEGVSRRTAQLAAAFASVMHEAFIEEHIKSKPTQEEFEEAVRLAAKYMLEMGFVLPRTTASPTGSQPSGT
jgi:hypothetical protein